MFQRFFDAGAIIVLCTLCLGLSIPHASAEEGTMANPFVYIGGYNNTVSCFVLDMATGTLQPASTSDCGQNPTYMAWHPSRKYMYAANEIDAGKVTAFSINPKDGALTKLNEASAAGHGPCHLSVSPNGKWVFTANYGSGDIGVLPVKPDGSVGEPVFTAKAGKNAHQIFTDSTGKYVFVPCLGSEYIAQYILDDATGQLTANTPPNSPIAKGSGPRHLAIHPNNRFGYLINEHGMTVNSLMYDAAAGTFSSPESIPTLPAGADTKGVSTAHIRVAPSGKFVYGSNRGNDTLVIYAVNAETGRLTLVGHENGGDEIKTPRDFSLDPTGKYLIAASQKTGVVIVFRVDQSKGTLEKLNTTKVPSGPAFVGIMPIP